MGFFNSPVIKFSLDYSEVDFFLNFLIIALTTDIIINRINNPMNIYPIESIIPIK